MRKKVVLIAMATAVLNWASISFSGAAENHMPYKGQQKRQIKALSSEEIDGYLHGKGMGFAKAAELNHYPGPLHVLDLSEGLELTPEQIQRSKSIFNAMKKRAVSLGEKIVATEKRLDQAFASGTVSAEQLQSLVTEIGSLQAQLRIAHLGAHLQQKAVLTPNQIHQYDRLRGYTEGGGHNHSHSHAH
ncbi:MAG: Spy/CpxP family protein refolding chaperone [Gammaproteobacteria bacterium]|nr:Spy/CpxP family protein refolding chaperone [Gammaproteobacteria bacterium]MDH5802773.1 Spy/CpxP family protein refolding chaperone [Gammaproteobacteria bacterium]